MLMINILSNFRMSFLSGSQKWVCESVVNYSLFFFAKVVLTIVSVLVLSLSDVSWRILKLQESYVQEMHGRYVKQFKY